jgi:hypothetical protein
MRKVSRRFESVRRTAIERRSSLRRLEAAQQIYAKAFKNSVLIKYRRA